jgi:magnesium chelatase subunit D
MTTPAAPDPWGDAVQAAAVFALDPAGLGGVSLRAPAGPVRDRWLALLRSMLDGPVRKLPLGITEDRLLGGVDLVATLAAGRPLRMQGALAEADGGVVLLAMAERVGPGTAARIAQAMDMGAVDGAPARFGLVLLDEGIDDECAPLALLDRVGIHLDFSAQPLAPVPVVDIESAQALLADVQIEDEAIEALCATAAALGVGSARAPLIALRVARAAAALAGRIAVAPEDVALAARLVLAPRATMLPPAPEQDQEPPPPPPDPEPPEPDAETEQPDPAEAEALADQVLEAARAAIPAGLLALLHSAGPRRAAVAGKSGALVKGARGRKLGAHAGMPRDGQRLDLPETLRAAAPWQRVRGRGDAATIRIRKDDLRITRRQQRAETTTIFLVDASGSLALNRLAEAKGAVELLLADCYIRRDQVAVLAFRGVAATLLLSPTRSLVRAKRSLAGLPGGGGTPLANGIEAGMLLADGVRRRGGTPTLVLLTDGQANVARDGRGGRSQAQADAMQAARLVRAAGHRALFIDTSPRPNPNSRTLAAAMDARYVPLPYADAASVSRSVRAMIE